MTNEEFIEELKSYRVGIELVSWHPAICDKAADYITDLQARTEEAEAFVRAYEDLVDRCINKIVPLFNDRLREARDARNEAVHDRMMMEQRVVELKARAENAEKCITEIEEALKFQRYSAAMLRIAEYRGKKEE